MVFLILASERSKKKLNFHQTFQIRVAAKLGSNHFWKKIKSGQKAFWLSTKASLPWCLERLGSSSSQQPKFGYQHETIFVQKEVVHFTTEAEKIRFRTFDSIYLVTSTSHPVWWVIYPFRSRFGRRPIRQSSAGLPPDQAKESWSLSWPDSQVGDQLRT